MQSDVAIRLAGGELFLATPPCHCCFCVETCSLLFYATELKNIATQGLSRQPTSFMLFVNPVEPILWEHCHCCPRSTE